MTNFFGAVHFRPQMNSGHLLRMFSAHYRAVTQAQGALLTCLVACLFKPFKQLDLLVLISSFKAKQPKSSGPAPPPLRVSARRMFRLFFGLCRSYFFTFTRIMGFQRMKMDSFESEKIYDSISSFNYV